MKLFNFTLLVFVLALGFGCSTTQRQPQNSVYEEVEVFSDDNDSDQDDDVVDNNEDHSKPEANRFDRICKEPQSQVLKVNNRIVTMINGQYISGHIYSSYDSGRFFIIRTDYGPVSQSRQELQLKRTSQELSKALDCVGMKTKKVYGMFKVGKDYYTGHVREVYANGVVRFVNDKYKEQFSTVDESYLEKLRAPEKLQYATFTSNGKDHKGQIRRVLEKDILLIKSNGKLFARKTNEVSIQD